MSVAAVIMPAKSNIISFYRSTGKEEGPEPGKHSLSFWCKCQRVPNPNDKKDWKCYAELELRLLPQDGDEGKVVKGFVTDVLTPESAAVGIYDFEDWKSIRDTRNGYCKSDTIKVETIVREMYPFVDVIEMPRFKCKLADKDGLMKYNLTKTFHPMGQAKSDVFIRFGNYRFNCHTHILSRCMPFRSRLHQQRDREKEKKKKKIVLPDDTNLTAFLSVLSFLYAGRLVVYDDNLIDLISISSSPPSSKHVPCS